MARKGHSDEDILELLRGIELKLAAVDDVASAWSERRDQRCDVLKPAEAVWRDGPVTVFGEEEPAD